jgi:hypothetical protein
MPTAAFDLASPFAKEAPRGPYRGRGTWVIGSDGHELSVRFELVEDSAGTAVSGGARAQTFDGIAMTDYPQWAVLLYRAEDWLAPQ